MLQLGVLSAAGRELQASVTCSELEGRGAAHAVSDRTLFYSAPTDARAPTLPSAHWRLARRIGPRGGGPDFRWMVGELDPARDALLFEDDVQPCRNAVAMMMRIEVPTGCGAVSFYDAGDTVGHLYAGMTCGLKIIPANGPADLGFHGAQAFRLPASTIARIQAGELDPANIGQDVWLGRGLHRLGLKIAVLCPSLVQHVGDDSLCSPGAALDGARAPAANFPGEDWDALQAWPTTITPGPWTTRARITWCEYHGIDHPDAVACPKFAR